MMYTANVQAAYLSISGSDVCCDMTRRTSTQMNQKNLGIHVLLLSRQFISLVCPNHVQFNFFE